MVATEKLTQELKAVREGAGLYDASLWGQFLVTGADAPGFLHRMLSNEVQKLAVGEGRYQGLLDRKGMTLSLFYLRRLGPQEFLAITPPQLTEKTIGLLTKMKFIEKVVIADVSKERGLLFLIGPQAETALGVSPPSEALLSWKDDNLQLPWFCVSGPKEEIAKTAASLADKTVPLSDTAVRLVGMQSGFPEYGKDLDEGSILLETSVPIAHQRSKGCYPGQEVIERISTYGKGRAPRRLCAFTLPGDMSFAKGTNILLKDGVKAGYVTSTLYNPLDGVTQVLASLETKHAEQVLADVGQCQFLSPASS